MNYKLCQFDDSKDKTLLMVIGISARPAAEEDLEHSRAILATLLDNAIVMSRQIPISLWPSLIHPEVSDGRHIPDLYQIRKKKINMICVGSEYNPASKGDLDKVADYLERYLGDQPVLITHQSTKFFMIDNSVVEEFKKYIELKEMLEEVSSKLDTEFNDYVLNNKGN